VPSSFVLFESINYQLHGTRKNNLVRKVSVGIGIVIIDDIMFVYRLFVTGNSKYMIIVDLRIDPTSTLFTII
jgi:hypothetical protein